MGTFFLKTGGAFRNLSLAWRASIALRNDSITREGDTLHIVSSFEQGFKMYDSPEGAPTVLSCKGTVTMSIDLSAAPRREMVDGKEVLIPQFTLNNGDVRFKPPAAD